MTERLFHHDSFLREFTATMLERRQVEGRPAAVLDRTAFYATSGGQPHDTGWLGETRVLEVLEDDAGTIVHVLDRAIAPGPVAGRIDWERRFDHMQQHSGQHVLSQAFVQTAGAATISFHLGRETSTIDLELESPSDEAIRAAESLASRIVFEDRPVTVLRARPEELAALGVRKQSDRQGELRVIDVEGFDRSPCGGTHVRTSGQIGLIGILGYERYKGGTRVEFVCGGRALQALRKDRDVCRQLARLYSAPPEELTRTADKVLQERSALQKENARLKEELLESEARALVSEGARLSGRVFVRKVFEGRGLDAVKVLAQKIVQQGGDLALLGSAAPSSQAVVARSARLPGDCVAAVKDANSRHGGKGGGRPELAQAGGLTPESLGPWLDSVEGYFRNL
jgi:alanyl-tRNA synthetase